MTRLERFLAAYLTWLLALWLTQRTMPWPIPFLTPLVLVGLLLAWYASRKEWK